MSFLDAIDPKVKASDYMEFMKAVRDAFEMLEKDIEDIKKRLDKLESKNKD